LLFGLDLLIGFFCFESEIYFGLFSINGDGYEEISTIGMTGLTSFYSFGDSTTITY
jgi:hypothetical protein